MSSTEPPHVRQVLDAIVKAYDVRGTVPDQLNADVAHALGVGFARFANAPRILVGRDMRPTGPELVEAGMRLLEPIGEIQVLSCLGHGLDPSGDLEPDGRAVASGGSRKVGAPSRSSPSITFCPVMVCLSIAPV